MSDTIKILTIEDDATLRLFFVQSLSERGYTVVQAADGQKGLELFRSENPDCVLLDFRMPGVPGHEVLRVLTKEAPNTPVIVVSGTSSMRQAVDAMRQGAWDYLIKPIEDIDELETSVLRALGRAEHRRKRIEQKERLESLVQQRTSQLEAEIEERKHAEAEMRLAKNAAEAANEAKNQFLANMSHELRTPLNAIIALTHMLRKSTPTAEQEHFLDLILDSSTELLDIVSDLLDLSTIHAERLELKEKQFPLREALQPLLDNANRQANAKGLDFVATVEDNVPFQALGDAFRLKQVLLNVLDNAVKFTEQGEIRVNVSLTNGSNAPEFHDILFEVKDTGIGIANDKLETIFESFTLGEDYMTKKYGGTGLGLAITRDLVERMGGEVWVESEAGHGSSFFFTIRLKRVEEEQNQSVFVAQQPAPPLPSLPGLRILLVEDEPVSRMFTRRMLHIAGHDVLLAEDGLKALDVLAAKPVDMVLMDLQLPHLNGIDTALAIRAGKVKGLNPDLPIIALTAFAMERDKKRGEEAGFDEYVVKPFDADALLETVDRVINSSQTLPS